ncbi:hypothetical protein OHA84_35640 [Streptomyces sp. NBC_00513]|uniref:hypothetical protein n=1 Tax=unclassified Streptomyces TaxID=2593676 RepID=UPI0022502AD2|nr:hypothetical protein [Streptomyces sp. NBC_00424]MCX5071158.1 hypothetical protein [Streptomyces sp. NBC_00424]WUD45424.1 hypothetical protein OHA84_35640 [Streptomyces sp. NBC_00513]
MTTSVTKFEVKALEIVPADLAARIEKAGSAHVADRHMRRYVSTPSRPLTPHSGGRLGWTTRPDPLTARDVTRTTR